MKTRNLYPPKNIHHFNQPTPDKVQQEWWLYFIYFKQWPFILCLHHKPDLNKDFSKVFI